MLKFFKAIVDFLRGVTRRDTSVSSLLGGLGADLPALPSSRAKALRQRIMERINAAAVIQHTADLLDRRIDRQIHDPKDFLEWLILIARELRQLPKVLPDLVWREGLRVRLVRNFSLPSFFGLLRQVAAFALLLALTIGVALTSFVSQTEQALAEVARLMVDTGTVQVRPADEIFFQSVKGNLVVRVGDTIRVSPDATARLSFLDASEMVLTADTELSITSAKLDLAATEKSAVKVALLNGKIETAVSKSPDAAAFEIETSAGKVSAQKATFAVTVDASGKTEVSTSAEKVAVMVGGQVVALAAGQTATLSGQKVLVAATTPLEVPGVSVAPITTDQIATPTDLDLERLVTEIDIAQIRLFDALIAAQAYEIEAGSKIALTVDAKLNQLTEEFGDLTQLDTHWPDVESLALIRSDLATIAKLKKLLAHYATNPPLLVGRPEFELLARDHYQPTPELAKALAVLRTRQLAHTGFADLADELLSTVAQELSANLAANYPERSSKSLLAAMGSEPVYLPLLVEMRREVPTAVRYLFDHKISELSAVLDAYVGVLE